MVYPARADRSQQNGNEIFCGLNYNVQIVQIFLLGLGGTGGMQEGILGAVEIIRSMGLPDQDTAEKIRKQYGLSEEADKLLAVKA